MVEQSNEIKALQESLQAARDFSQPGDLASDKLTALATKLAALEGGSEMSDEDAAAAVNALTHATETTRIDVPCRLAFGVLASADVWPDILLACRDSVADSAPATWRAAVLVRDVIVPQMETGVIRTSNTLAYNRVDTALAALVEANVLSADQKALLLGLANQARKWADVEMGRLVTARDIGRARLGG